MYEDELKILEKHIHALELAEQSVLHYRQSLDLIQGKFLDAYLIKAIIKFGDERQGILVFILSKLRKKIICIKGAFINDNQSQTINQFYPESTYSSAELDEIFLTIESYNTYSFEYSNQLAINIYKNFDSHLISRIILDLEKKNNMDRIKNKIYEVYKARKQNNFDLEIHVGFQDISSLKYRMNSEIEKGYKQISFILKEEEIKSKKEDKTKENTNSVMKIESEKDNLGSKFNEFYRNNHKNFFFTQTIVDPINGVPIDKITEEHNVYVNFVDSNLEKIGEEDKTKKKLAFPYKDLFECKSDKKYYLFLKYKDNILYSIEEDKSVKLKVQNISEINNEKEQSNTEKPKKYLDNELFKVGLMFLMVLILLIYLFFK